MPNITNNAQSATTIRHYSFILLNFFNSQLGKYQQLDKHFSMLAGEPRRHPRNLPAKTSCLSVRATIQQNYTLRK